MSTTRHAAPGIPFRQERFASCETYRSSLNALLVGKRCALLRHDRELVELIWLIQEQSLADPYNVGNRAGSIDQVAADLLALAGYVPMPKRILFEDMGTGEFSHKELPPSEVEKEMRADLVEALSDLALDPKAPRNALPGLGAEWRSVLVAYRAQLKERAKQSVAATSALKQVVESLRFTRETGMPSLTMGVSRLGKSAAAKAFCAASGGLVRYVLTPEDDHMGSLYRAIAKAVGVADALSKKDTEVRELVEKTLHTSRLMLVFDEAHNLFCGCNRLRREPGRILWLRRLIDGKVPVAFVALKDFKRRVTCYVEQLDWDAAQITDVIARETTLPPTLQESDFDLLVTLLAPELSADCKKVIVTAATSQRGAQYVADLVKVARHAAEKAGRPVSESDVDAAIGGRPRFQTGAAASAPIGRPKTKPRVNGGTPGAGKDTGTGPSPTECPPMHAPTRGGAVAVPAL